MGRRRKEEVVEQGLEQKVDGGGWWGRGVLLVVLAIVPYLSGIPAEFSFDDNVAIRGNPDVMTHEPGVNWTALATNDFWGNPILGKFTHKSFRPFTVLTFRVGHLIHGMLPPWFRVTNILLHVVVVLLVPRFTQELFGMGKDAAWSVAALFAVHPAHSESVTSLVGRADVLCALFAILASLAYARGWDGWAGGKKGVFWGGMGSMMAALCIFLALVCKELAFCIPPALGLVDLVASAPQWTRNLKGFEVWNLRGLIARGMGMIVTVAGVVAFRRWTVLPPEDRWRPGARLLAFQFLSRQDNPLPYIENPMERACTVMYTWVMYAKLLFFPVHLSADYSYNAIPTVRPFDPTDIYRVLEIATLLCGIGGCVWVGCYMERRVLATLAWIVAFLLPAMHVFLYPAFFIAERLLYLPSLGSCALIVLLISFFTTPTTTSTTSRSRFVFSLKFIVGVLASFWSVLLLLRNIDWVREDDVFDSALQYVPDSSKVRLQAASTATRQGEDAEAIIHLRRVMEIDPLGCNIHYFNGRQLVRMHEYDTALQQLSEGFSCAHLNIGARAKDTFVDLVQYLIRREPQNPRWHLLLGEVLAKQGRYEGALMSIKRSIQVEESAGFSASGNTLVQLAFVERASGNAKEAHAIWDDLLLKYPKDKALHAKIHSYRPNYSNPTSKQ